MKRTFCLIALVSGVSLAHAFTFSGPSTYLVAPQTQAPGVVTNNLNLTDVPGGFSISGQYIVNVTAGTHSGTLLEYEVERPIDPTYPTGFETLTSLFVGFVDAPAGAFGGSLIGNSYTFNYPNSNTPVNWTYPGTGVWAFNVSNSTTFGYTIGGGQFLRQRFIVTYSYSNTIGGQYVVDLPATTLSQPVPEPATWIMLGLGGLFFSRRARRRS